MNSGRVTNWRRERPPADAGWPLRLRFVIIAVALAYGSWSGVRLTAGWISFAWLLPIQQQVSTLTASLHGSSGSAVAGVTAAQSPLAPLPVAQAVPAAAAAPASRSAPPLVLESATPVARPTAPAQPPVVIVPPVVAVSATATSTAPTPAAARATPMATPGATATVALAAGPHTIYVVQAGDTLWGIAKRYGLSPTALAELNHIAAPYTIGQGKRLLIPLV